MAIVVGTDFSAPASEAIRAAAALALRLGERLSLAHVLQPMPARRVREAQAAAEEHLAEEKARLTAEGVDVQTELLTGSPDEALVELAERTGAHLLVAAARGWQTGQRWMLGSAAERLAQTTRCPLLLVRTAEPFLAWARGERRLRVVVGDDFSRLSAAALRWVQSLRRVGPCDVTVAFVYAPFEEYRRLGLTSPGTGTAEVEAVLAGELRERLAALGETQARVRPIPSFGRPAEPLVTLAEEERADLGVLGTHQWSPAKRLWHGSTSHHVLHLAPMSVALVPEHAAEPVVQPIATVRRVLAATDLSELGNLAIPHALSLLPGGGELFVVHVVEQPAPFIYPEAVPGYVPTPPLSGEEQEALRARLARLIPPEAQARGVEVHLEVLPSQGVASAIAQAAERHLADVVCLSSHGRSGHTRRAMGTVARSALEKLHRPVLLVRPPAAR